MTPEEYDQQLGRELLDYQVKAQKEIADMLVHEVTFKAQTAQHQAQQAETEKEASAVITERSKLQSANFIRPCLIHRPLLTKEGDAWAVTYGHLVAYGPTPETAHQEFDRIWVGKDEL